MVKRSIFISNVLFTELFEISDKLFRANIRSRHFATNERTNGGRKPDVTLWRQYKQVFFRLHPTKKQHCTFPDWRGANEN